MLSRLRRWLSPSPGARESAIRLRGHIVARDTIEAPVSGRRCVYVRRVLERRSLGEDSARLEPTEWQVMDVTEEVAEFYLAVAGDRVVVAPFAIDVAIDERFAERAVIAGGLRAAEHVLLPGDEVEVVGERAEIDDPYSDAPAMRGGSRCDVIRAPDGGRLRVRLISRG